MNLEINTWNLDTSGTDVQISTPRTTIIDDKVSNHYKSINEAIETPFFNRNGHNKKLSISVKNTEEEE